MSWRLGAVLTLLASTTLLQTETLAAGPLTPLVEMRPLETGSAGEVHVPHFPNSEIPAIPQPPSWYEEESPFRLTGLHLGQLFERSSHHNAGPAAAAYRWELLPAGLMFRSYMAGEKEPRFAGQWLWDKNQGLVWETAMGGRWGIVRYGSPHTIDPEGFQLDFEGAALARVLPEEQSDLGAVDFRLGMVGTWHVGRWRTKFGYSHLSSHIGDEFFLKHPAFDRRNYVRDSILAAVMYNVTDELQVYGETAYAFNANGGAKPMEIQFGAQIADPEPTGPHGVPFAAVNCHWRQEFRRQLAVNIEAGWLWRGRHSGHTFRAGFQHYSGPSLQYQLFDLQESLNGLGIWFDF